MEALAKDLAEFDTCASLYLRDAEPERNNLQHIQLVREWHIIDVISTQVPKVTKIRPRS
jgi:hypothetical protein